MLLLNKSIETTLLGSDSLLKQIYRYTLQQQLIYDLDYLEKIQEFIYL